MGYLVRGLKERVQWIEDRYFNEKKVRERENRGRKEMLLK
jgi:hypothetical protein